MRPWGKSAVVHRIKCLFPSLTHCLFWPIPQWYSPLKWVSFLWSIFGPSGYHVIIFSKRNLVLHRVRKNRMLINSLYLKMIYWQNKTLYRHRTRGLLDGSTSKRFCCKCLMTRVQSLDPMVEWKKPTSESCPSATICSLRYVSAHTQTHILLKI